MSKNNRRRTLGAACFAGICAALVASGPPFDAGYFPSSLFIGAAHAQSGQSVTLTSVRADTGLGIYTFPTLTFSGTTLSREELEALFAGGGEAAGKRLSGLSAASITAPEMIVEVSLGEVTQRSVYRDVVASNVVEGRIESLVSAGGTVETSGGPEPQANGRYGRLEIKGFDLAFTARVYSEVAGTEPNEFRPIYETVSLEDIRFTEPGGADATISRMTGSDFRARLPRQPIGNFFTVMGTLQTKGEDSKEAGATALALVADIIDSFTVGTFEMNGMAVSDPKDTASTGRIARISYEGERDGKSARARMEGLAFTSDGGTFRIGSISSTGFSGAPAFEGLREILAKPGQEPDPATLRRLIPTIGTLRIEDVAADVEQEDSEELSFTLRAMEITADRPINNVPTNIRLAIENLAFDVPSDTEDENLEQLIAMGYEALNLSGAIAAAWDEAGNELVIREISVDGDGMGRIALHGVIGNLTRDVYDPDQAVALVALLGGTARNLHFTVQNRGLIERVLAYYAEEQGTTSDALRTQFAGMASAMLPTVLGNSPNAKALSQAVARFIARPGELTISATSKDPDGLGVADLMMLEQPAEILNQLDITAEAN